MKQVSYLSQIANRARARSDRPSADQLMLNPPRLLFRQGEGNQTGDWGDETPLSDQVLESPLSQLPTSDMVSVQPVPPQTEAGRNSVITSDVVSVQPTPLQTEAVTNLAISATDAGTQLLTSNVAISSSDNHLSLKSIGVPASARPGVNKSATGYDINPQPVLQGQSQPQAEAGTTSQIGLESAAIASPTLSLMSSPGDRCEAIADPSLLPLTTILKPGVHRASAAMTQAANLPGEPLQTTLEPSRLIEFTQAPGIAESAPPQQPTVHIGAIEIQISPPAVTLPTPTAKTVTRAAPPATGSLSRGFTSTFGLCQG
ncbi:hypothetical protein [Nostoc sp. WHI]|uniref:hypothetical protein n=1 Tax=Nostoc sp. WHI TaxID=2650611 RepID=UPI0018C6E614|nr:hypothetical protein [Nostoc sp. WHI]MBG1270889.1 hypothetical protein [Nostoc sp. WHI]